jgi:hypothetical protein
MAANPQSSLPKQHPRWSDLKAAYRFLHNPKVSPDRIQSTHRAQVRQDCLAHSHILALQDGTELDYTKRRLAEGLGFIGDGGGQGLLQHSALGVTPDGELLGVLHQRWWRRQRTPEGETRRQRQARKTEAGLWADAIQSIGSLGASTRLIHVMDRGSDCFETMDAARRVGVGFVLRAKHNRYLEGSAQALWPFLSSQPMRGSRPVSVASRPARGSKPRVPARTARLAMRYAPVIIPPPRNDPRFAHAEPLQVWGVYAVEAAAPKDVEPIEWMLLTSEPVHTLGAANEIMDWYTQRWVIEEWHKVEKTGCRLEASQLRDGSALERLAALTAVVAVRMLQLRDLARPAGTTEPLVSWSQMSAGDRSANRHLRRAVPPEWLAVVAHLAGCPIDDLSPGLFWLTIARQGGFIGRRGDGWPGWQTLWGGWSRISDIVYGLELARTWEGSYG